MDQLPIELLLEALSLLTVPTITVTGNINKLMRELTEEKWLIRQFLHCQIDNKLVFHDKLVYLDFNVDITNQLLKISQDSYQSNEQLLWCLVQYIAGNAAWNAGWDTDRSAARFAAQDAAWFAAWDAVCVPVWDAALDAAGDAALDAALDAARDDARDAAWDAARDAACTVINNHKITDLKLIGQLAYISAERTILIKLPEIVKSCRAILTEKIPNYREIVFNLEIPTDTTNPFFLQYRQLFG